MKFSSTKFPRLVLNGVRPGPGSRAARFVDGVYETDDPKVAERVLRNGARFGVTALKDDSGSPFDPTRASAKAVNDYLTAASPAERARVLDAERAGKNRPTATKGFDEPESKPVEEAPRGSNTRSTLELDGAPAADESPVHGSTSSDAGDVIGNDSPTDVLGGDQAPAEG